MEIYFRRKYKSRVLPRRLRHPYPPGVDVLYFFFSPGLGVHFDFFAGGAAPHSGSPGLRSGFHHGTFGSGIYPGSLGSDSGLVFLLGGTGSFVAPACGGSCLHPFSPGLGMGFLPGPGSSGFESSEVILTGGSGSFVACGFGFFSLPILRASSLGVTVRTWLASGHHGHAYAVISCPFQYAKIIVYHEWSPLRGIRLFLQIMRFPPRGFHQPVTCGDPGPTSFGCGVFLPGTERVSTCVPAP
jgi:hypothetical protein